MDYNAQEVLVWSFIISICAFLALICIIVYFQSKQKDFLYYGLYNLVLSTYIFTKSPLPMSWKDIYYDSPQLLTYNWFSQEIYISFLFIFYMRFMNIHLNNIRTYNVVKYVILICFFLGLLFFILGFFTAYTHLVKSYFFYVFLPIVYILTVYFLILFFSKKTDKYLGYFSITGIVVYNVLAYMAFFKSLFSDDPNPIRFFYYAIFCESIVFMIGLGYKIKLLYVEKLKTQQLIIKKQKRINDLQNHYQNDLKKEITEREQHILASQKIIEQNKIDEIKTNYDAQLKNSRLDALRSQMNPHFLFNALNSIKVYLIQNDKEKAVVYLNKFSMLIRNILEGTRTEFYNLEEELKVIELYMSIENIRFENPIAFEILRKPNDDFSAVKVPPLFLQPFVENAIWHGLSRVKHEKKIQLEIVDSSSTEIILKLKDNGVGRVSAENAKFKKGFKKGSLGLKLTEERFDLFNQKFKFNNSFEFEDLYDHNHKPIGTQVIFRLCKG